MDTGTYPKIAATAAKFVCVRIDYDKNPAVVKQYGVKPLPDVRMLSPEGKDLAKFIGRTSPEKLEAAMKRVLEGKPATEAAREAPRKKVPVTPEAIEVAVRKGADSLETAWKKGWKQNPGWSSEEVALYALAAAGRKPDPTLLDRVLKAELKGIYQAAFKALALRRIDAKGYAPELEEIAKFLIAQQTKSGSWSYGKLVAPSDQGDNSNTAYAILGLRACAATGVSVPPATWSAAASWWKRVQNADGGWGYRADRETESYLSMTESGVSSLAIAAPEAARDKGVAWLDKNFAAEKNVGSAYQEGRLIYHLYAAERVAAITGRELWKECVAFLLGTQREDGSWDDGADTPVPNTAMALLVLTHATKETR